jgi:phosphoglucosamine mutase
MVEHRGMTKNRYFGTDGIRGRVGSDPITPEFALRLGRAIASVIRKGGEQRPTVLIGKDTRISGYMLESALEAGLAAAGANIVLLGPMTTPAVAFLTRSQRGDAGIVISASHNPYADNGIKLFSALGEKLDDEIESAIEDAIDAPPEPIAPALLGKARRLEDAPGRYLEFLKSRLEASLAPLSGLRIVVDAAHGAGYRLAPMLFEELGFHVHSIGVEPNGFNINDGVGATDITALRGEVARTGADLGLALDGDGDRLMVVTNEGRLIDGDDLVYLLARHWQASGRLRGPVVGTVMTNLGIERALARAGIGFCRAAVGDRHVHQLLKETGGILGGEASGHLLCLDKASTGDGLLSALLLLETMAVTGKRPEALVADLHRYPQRTVNVRLERGAKEVATDAAVLSAKAAVEAELGQRGRVILRASGTEPVVRVTIEAEDAAEVECHVQALAAEVKAVAARLG